MQKFSDVFSKYDETNSKHFKTALSYIMCHVVGGKGDEEVTDVS